MTLLGFNAWRRLLWDACLELATGSRRDCCGARVSERGTVECERRARHRGKHAMVRDGLTAIWRQW